VDSLSSPDQTDPIVPDPEREDVLAYGRELEIARLKDHAALRPLRDALADTERAMTEFVARGVLTSGKEIDQRHLDYTRGYFAGARFWLEGRIALATQRALLLQEKLDTEKAAAEDPRPRGRIDPRTGEPRTEGT
jgi:hypothetical protein